MKKRAWWLLPVLACLASCSKPPVEDVEPPLPEWIIPSHVVFVENDGKTVRAAPKQSKRLWMPYVVGDLYGSPNEGELSEVKLAPDLSFTLNLNLKHLRLGKSLLPTQFSQRWMSIELAEARVARLLPFVQSGEGIEPLGLTEWLDADTGERLMLVYVDRPARIRGDVVYEGRSLRFDIDAPEAGFMWILQPQGSGEFHAVPRPRNLVLAVMPGD